MRKIIRNIILILILLTLTSFEYQPQIREPFEDYKVEQPYQAPAKAPIDWDNLDYDNPVWGWYYKQLWYLYHPNSTETPPWIKTVPIEGCYVLLFFGFMYAAVLKYTNRKNLPFTN